MDVLWKRQGDMGWKGVGVNSIAKCQLPEARTDADGTGKEKTWKAKGKGERGTRLDDWECGVDGWRGWMYICARVEGW